MLALLGDEMLALLGDEMFALLGDKMLAHLGDEMLALLAYKMFALLGDEMLARLGDEMLALLGDEMLAPDRDSARSNCDVARPTRNNDRRESPSKSKGVVSLNRENKGCPALKNEIKITKECKRCPGMAQWLTCSHIDDGSNGSLARISRRTNGAPCLRLSQGLGTRTSCLASQLQSVMSIGTMQSEIMSKSKHLTTKARTLWAQLPRFIFATALMISPHYCDGSSGLTSFARRL